MRTHVLAATTEGTLFALNADGSTRWSVDAGTQLNDVVTADLTGDGKDEIVLARQDYHVQVLNLAGEELWKRELSYYRRPPYVNLVRTGDLDGDGTPEVIAGGENWRFYAFRADGTELWNYESVHPSRSGAVADLDGDGKAEVICGTHYYWASVLNADGPAPLAIQLRSDLLRHRHRPLRPRRHARRRLRQRRRQDPCRGLQRQSRVWPTTPATRSSTWPPAIWTGTASTRSWPVR